MKWKLKNPSDASLELIAVSQKVGIQVMAEICRGREDDLVLRRAQDFEVEGQRKKGEPKGTLKKLIEEESVKVGLSMEDAFC